MVKRLLLHLDSSVRLIRKQDLYRQIASSILHRCISRCSKVDDDRGGGNDDSKVDKPELPLETKKNEPKEIVKDSTDDNVRSGGMWKTEMDWISKTLEPAYQLYKWASTTGSNESHTSPTSTLSLSEILSHLQLNKVSIQDWSISDLTVGLYLIYLNQASAKKVEDVNGVQITSDFTVQELVYHIELAKGAYKDNTTALARHTMLLERNILKFVKDSSVMRPGYYIGVDKRNKLVILGIRGTHTVSDIITDVVSSGDKEVSFEGFSTHFGTAEAARWYLRHEIETIRKCLEEHKGFRLRIVGHSLGGAAAALLAIMLRKMSAVELGFSPDIVSAIGFGAPPCVSKELAENCASYVTTVVLQDDVIPRLSAASIKRLRSEILETDWMSVLEKEEWKGVIDLVTNAKQVVSSVQDAVSSVQDLARRLSDYANFRKATKASGNVARKDPAPLPTDIQTVEENSTPPQELYVPGTLYFLKRNIEDAGSEKGRKYYTLWRRPPGEHFQRILLSGNLISDHRCDSHYYALRDVLKSFHSLIREFTFREYMIHILYSGILSVLMTHGLYTGC